MPTKKQVNYIGVDVLTEAKKRIRHVMNCFDSIYVAFSGGKDSLAVLYLVEEVYREMGMSDRVSVIFRDEELIPDSVIDFVQWHYHQKDRFDLRYYAVPLANQRYIFGALRPYIQWDIKRKWIRPKPEFAIGSWGKAWDENPGIQHDVDRKTFEGEPGKIALINGVRADESLTRYRSCVNKRNENYINATAAKNVKFVKPIFDWSQKDVFKYFYDRKIKYCKIYDMQMWARVNLRVATPLHAKAFKTLSKMRAMYPIFYDQMLSIWPDIDAHAIYWGNVDRLGIIKKYPASWAGIEQYIVDNIPPENQAFVTEILRSRRVIRHNNIQSGMVENFGGYPALHIFRSIVVGDYLKGIQPKHPKAITKEEREYEAMFTG